MAWTMGIEPIPEIGSILSSLGDWCATVTLCPHGMNCIFFIFIVYFNSLILIQKPNLYQTFIFNTLLNQAILMFVYLNIVEFVNFISNQIFYYHTDLSRT